VEKFSPGDIIDIRDGTVQNAENFTEAAMDMPALKNLETAMLQMTIEKARNSYAAQGFDPKTFKPSVQSSSVYMTVEGEKAGNREGHDERSGTGRLDYGLPA
jgi:hypothetical protein